jgi:hypothetical protein
MYCDKESLVVVVVSKLSVGIQLKLNRGSILIVGTIWEKIKRLVIITMDNYFIQIIYSDDDALIASITVHAISNIFDQ